MTREAGFTLIEAVAVMAIIAMLASLALPRWPHETNRSMLEAYALQTAALLKTDRIAAVRRRSRVETVLDLREHQIISGSGAGLLQMPADVAMDAMVAETCEGRRIGSAIDFLPSGMSCGGTVALARPGAAYHVRVNWLTGGVEVVASESAR